MKDQYGREINYLRLSVTELCNLRCRYCMPETGVCKKPHEAMLTEDEMIAAVEAAASLGVTKLRITGGEPLVKRNIMSICARVLVSRETFGLIKTGGMKKGDVLTVAQIAGVMGAKRTPDLIPMCHPIALTGINLELSLDEARCAVDIRATVSCDGKTGVEMEALTAASTAALTVYDMCKAVQKDMVITDVRLLSKTGGVHGDFARKDDET